MKKSVFFTFVYLSISYFSLSQINQGISYIGGSFNAEYKYRASGVLGGENKTTSIPININYGKFIIPQLAIGFGIGYTYYRETRRTSSKDSTYTFNLPTYTFVPQAKYFFPIWGNKFYFVTSLNLNYGLQKLKVNLSGPLGNEIAYKGSRFIMDLNIRPSLLFFINPRFAIEGTFGYFGYNRILRTDSKNNLSGSKNDYNVKLSFDPSTITIGLNYFFPGKDKTVGKDEK